MNITQVSPSQLKVTWPRYPRATHECHFQSSSGIIKLPQIEKATAAVLETPRGHDTMKGYFMMQPHSTPDPYFPENLDDYAPWVATHGLLAPYGECQCGCGDDAPLAQRQNPSKGQIRGKPARFTPGHHARVQVRRPLKERFWEKVAKRGPDECWEWIASTTHGYGQINAGSHVLLAHRLSYEFHNGSIPDGLFVCHHCDNPICVNPRHLFLGTNADNVRDMVNKDRNCRGERQGASKLTESDIAAIRQRYSNGEKQRVLAREFDVSVAHMHRIVHRKEWRHMP